MPEKKVMNLVLEVTMWWESSGSRCLASLWSFATVWLIVWWTLKLCQIFVVAVLCRLVMVDGCSGGVTVGVVGTRWLWLILGCSGGCRANVGGCFKCVGCQGW